MYQPTSFDLTTSSQLNTPEMSFYQRHDSIDYSRRLSYQFIGFNASEASLSDQEQQTPSPFTGYEDYHPLEKRRLSHLPPSPPYMEYNSWYQSPMMYAHPIDMYNTAPFVPQCPTEGIIRNRASSSSSSSDGSYVDSPPASRRASKAKSTKSGLSRGRRTSSCIAAEGQKMFSCTFDDCGKVFKRSEHLKRHVRSIHTLEKPYECPYQSCSKRFSRSDNLNQHIRIHRNTPGKDKNNKANMTSTTRNHTNFMPY